MQLFTSTRLEPFSYWRAVLTTGRTLYERHPIFALRPLDWTLDVVSTGDIHRLKEVWLVCPNGQEVYLPIFETDTAFQFKTNSLHAIGANDKVIECQVIGKVTDKANGLCVCWIWDRLMGLIPYESNVHHFGSHHPRLAPIGELATDVQGLKL